jgi:hypothetical protein
VKSRDNDGEFKAKDLEADKGTAYACIPKAK